MATLYNLTEEFAKILNMVGDEEDFESVLEQIETLEMSIANKLNGYAKVIKEVDGSIATIKAETERLTARKKSKENLIKSLKQRMQDAMERIDERKIDTDLFCFAIQNSPVKLVIENLELVPPEYLFTRPPEVDTKAVKDALKSGDLVENENIRLEQGQHLRIS